MDHGKKTEEYEAPTNRNERNPAISEELRDYYSQHGVDVDRLADTTTSPTTRFVRLNPRKDPEETLSLLKQELDPHPLLPVPWLDGFYALPGDFGLAQSSCYQQARLYGMDVSSGAAVAALLSNRYDQHPTATTSGSPPHRVLDLCCAPGLKLCALADALPSNSLVVGVDIAEHRLATTKRILHKYRLQEDDNDNDNAVRIRLYCGNGTQFDQPHVLPTLVFDSQTARDESAISGKRKRMNKSARARERKRLKTLTTIDFVPQKEDDEEETTTGGWKSKLFDCVLVDAECSTDGSLKHIQKQITTAATNTTPKQSQQQVATLLTDSKKLAALVELQKQLAAAGFRMLQPGGTMVYSTCSLSTDQNEHVVQWLLQEYDTAFLIPLDFASQLPNDNTKDTMKPKIKQGEWGVRFEPQLAGDSNAFFGGGFFLAKIGKKEKKNKSEKQSTEAKE
jgi:16S rRNA C967 or C1407 C5-methylase (RsmB/RsmF family)